MQKKGSLIEPFHCIPISLLPLISKVIEKVIHKYFPKFEKPFTHLSIWFSKKAFYRFCISYLNDKILKGFDKGMMTGMILIDLQKSFDTSDHDVLWQKFFSKNFSQPASASCGVLRGFILGPLLFLIYVNDMS